VAEQEVAMNCKRRAGSNGNIQMSLYTALSIICAFLRLYTKSADISGAENSGHIKLIGVKNKCSQEWHKKGYYYCKNFIGNFK
jgi:hypothetical protein